MTTGEFTENFRQSYAYLKTTSDDHLLDVIRQLGPIWIHR